MGISQAEMVSYLFPLKSRLCSRGGVSPRTQALSALGPAQLQLTQQWVFQSGAAQYGTARQGCLPLP